MKVFNKKAQVEQAYDTAKKYHSEQKRKHLNIPYILHPIDVVSLLKYWGINKDKYLAIAYMHDLLEDTNITEAEIEKVYGRQVLDGIKALSFNYSQTKDKDEWLKEIANKAEDYIVIIKIADRLVNVVDFLRSKMYEKAEKYWRKAEPIVQRINKITEVDNSIMKKIENSIEDIEKVFRKNRIIAAVVNPLIERRDYGHGDQLERNAIELKKKKLKIPKELAKRIK